MKENELRVGNIIHNGNFEARINSFDEMNEFFILMAPVELTEEWLFKFGFQKGIDWYWLYKYPRQINVSITHRKTTIGSNEEYEVECKYVHQLQNLYFALTGEELTIKE